MWVSPRFQLKKQGPYLPEKRLLKQTDRGIVLSMCGEAQYSHGQLLNSFPGPGSPLKKSIRAAARPRLQSNGLLETGQSPSR